MDKQQKSLAELRQESENLINEIGEIYMCDGWRDDQEKVDRAKWIEAKLSQIFAETRAL